MKQKKKIRQINYFEEIYLGKKGIGISIQESKRLQKLLGVKALKSSVHSGGITTSDLKRINKNNPASSFMDIDNFLLPFDL
jgi:hypothetical protein